MANKISIDPKLTAIDILELIPQRRPFVMVDRLLTCNGKEADTELMVREDNVLVVDGMLTAGGVIENMAQSGAARIGCINRQNNEAVKVGFIGDIRDCDIVRLPKCGETLITHVTVIEEIFNLTLAEVCVYIDGEFIAKCRMKIALMEEAKD